MGNFFCIKDEPDPFLESISRELEKERYQIKSQLEILQPQIDCELVHYDGNFYITSLMYKTDLPVIEFSSNPTRINYDITRVLRGMAHPIWSGGITISLPKDDQQYERYQMYKRNKVQFLCICLD